MSYTHLILLTASCYSLLFVPVYPQPKMYVEEVLLFCNNYDYFIILDLCSTTEISASIEERKNP